ncbi:adenine deaminase [Orenia metallireducens]|uniref:Adenine deaminase n=1 Tax=Orenia metallireducens TaxID=1413210 RepID=A0A285GG96_9FIRM|nr:adenine deaminase [Orenia metallireducens]PRX30443.1 adenine deaminase [Orenia metallireducens]SNY22587.1 Adenine deaminase [Orenia metallireducens]
MKHLLKQARGDKPVDLLFKNGKIVDVFNGELVEESLAVSDGVIIGYGDYQAQEEIDLAGRILAPGFVDGHFHLESSMVGVQEFAKQVIALGTTTVFADPHEIANVSGRAGIEYILKEAQNLPWNFNLMLPSAVPATSFESSGAKLGVDKLAPLLKYQEVFGLGEVMNYSGVIKGEEDIWNKVELMEDRFKDGHAPNLSGKELNAYLLAGIKADHECTTAKEALEKIRAGMYVMIREGSMTKDLLSLIAGVNARNSRRFLFATDDRHPDDLITEGHINFLMKKATQAGLDPIEALRLGTINSAEALGMAKLGAIAPGYQGDLVVIDNFDSWEIEMVFKDGKLVAKGGEALFEIDSISYQDQIFKSVNLGELSERDFMLPKGRRFRVMKLEQEQIITKEAVVALKSGDSQELINHDLVKLAVVERHRGTGNLGLGLLNNFGLKEGAIATSIAHDSHNIIVAGLESEEMLLAVKRLEELQGGIVIVKDNKVLMELALPIAGLMSDQPLVEVAYRLQEMKEKARHLGVKATDPFMSLSFMALAVIPELKLTDQGLINVKEFKQVSLVVD